MKRLKGNNKGFSLVELIIVIAIMAALVAILAPQFLKYVEKSRTQADDTTADTMVSAAQVVCADPDYVIPDGEYHITWAGSGGAITIPTTDIDPVGSVTLQDAVKENLGGVSSEVVKSSTYSADTFRIQIVVDNGVGTITYGWATADSFAWTTA